MATCAWAQAQMKIKLSVRIARMAMPLRGEVLDCNPVPMGWRGINVSSHHGVGRSVSVCSYRPILPRKCCLEKLKIRARKVILFIRCSDATVSRHNLRLEIIDLSNLSIMVRCRLRDNGLFKKLS
jgi:hypothetical protein